MLVFTVHAGIYDPCWYLRFILVFIYLFIIIIFFEFQKFLMHNIQSLNEYKKMGGGGDMNLY